MEKAIKFYVRGGGNEKRGIEILNELIARVSVANLPSALVYEGFCKERNAEKIASELVN